MKPTREIKRSIPALGTFLEIKCISSELNLEKTQNIITQAFNLVGILEKFLSFHEEKSDLNKINQANLEERISICLELSILLRLSLHLNKITDGIFNIIIPHKTPFLMDKYFQLQGFKIKSLQNYKIDLGGIAKGFIVDKITKFLLQNNIEGGIINAGGDIRIFGNYNAEILIRDPFYFSNNFSIGNYSKKAIASSSISENSKERGGKSKIFKSTSNIIHASIIGENCTICDALTKITLINPDKAYELIKKINYKGIIIDKNGQIFTS